MAAKVFFLRSFVLEVAAVAFLVLERKTKKVKNGRKNVRKYYCCICATGARRPFFVETGLFFFVQSFCSFFLEKIEDGLLFSAVLKVYITIFWPSYTRSIFIHLLFMY